MVVPVPVPVVPASESSVVVSETRFPRESRFVIVFVPSGFVRVVVLRTSLPSPSLFGNWASSAPPDCEARKACPCSELRGTT